MYFKKKKDEELLAASDDGGDDQAFIHTEKVYSYTVQISILMSCGTIIPEIALLCFSKKERREGEIIPFNLDGIIKSLRRSKDKGDRKRGRSYAAIAKKYSSYLATKYYTVTGIKDEVLFIRPVVEKPADNTPLPQIKNPFNLLKLKLRRQ